MREGAKLDYDSLGYSLNGQTIEIAFVAGDLYDDSSAITYSHRIDAQASNHIIIAIDLFNYGKINPTDPNGNTDYNGGEPSIYLDRVIAHEMVHAIMMSTGTFKNGMPQFFTEGIADLVQGDDDYNSDQSNNVIDLVNDTDTLVKALVLTPGTGSKYAYPAGDMFLRYLAKQSLDVTAMLGDSTPGQIFSYITGDAVISGYKEGDVINFHTTENSPLRVAYSSVNDLVILDHTANFDSTNELIVRDSRGKLITINGINGGQGYAYMAPSSSEINGSAFNNGANYEIIMGSNYENDVIRAGNAGSELWGGIRGNDELFGGGADKFLYYLGDGSDTIYNAESQDTVLLSTSLAQISGAEINDNGVYFTFTDGGVLNVSGQAGTFVVEENDNYTFYKADYQNKTWTQQ